MRKFLALAAVAMMTATGALAQRSQPAGMRVEVAEAETDHGEYSIFTYQNTDSVSTFGYYLSLGRTADFLGADEILRQAASPRLSVEIYAQGTPHGLQVRH